ncbi:hypothetical protein C6A85_10610, partial [Mycobacterium sp. ITM-2017-0098]
SPDEQGAESPSVSEQVKVDGADESEIHSSATDLDEESGDGDAVSTSGVSSLVSTSVEADSACETARCDAVSTRPG